MKPARPCVLTINGGSSSIRFAIYEAGSLRLRFAGKIDRIGARGTALTVTWPAGKSPPVRRLAAGDHGTAVNFLIAWLERQPAFAPVQAVGHRVVHGLQHTAPERITPQLLAELRRITPYDPDHLPA
jgi:acetate kinase